MRYWWVNHKQTKRQELHGGYLWSPKREANGVRSQFYDNMRLAEPGDMVLSYADGVIGNVGSVLDIAITAPKPDIFKATGANWSKEGWMLPVAWRKLAVPARPKDKLKELAPLLPAKYSPIQPASGDGNQKAYLAEVSKAVFELLLGPSQAVVSDDPENSPVDLVRSIESKIEDDIWSSSDLDSTTKQQTILARHGQGLFRWRVAQLERACRVTGLDNPQLLIASHIKPWRLCSTATERLDGANGLLLAPHVDRLFDRGFITFDPTGTIHLSPKLGPADLQKLGLSEACSRNCGTFSAAQATFLSFHKEHIFLF